MLSAMTKSTGYQVVYVGALAALWIATMFIHPGSLGVDVTIADKGKATLDYLTELSKLVVSLNTALFTACGALAVKGGDWSDGWTNWDGYCIVVALVCGAGSYYGTYLAYTAIVEMVFAGVVDPFSPRLSSALQIQYYGVLAGIFLVGLVFCRMLAARKSKDAVATPPAVPALNPVQQPSAAGSVQQPGS